MNLGRDSTGGDLPTPVDLALDQLGASLDHLVKLVEDGGLVVDRPVPHPTGQPPHPRRPTQPTAVTA